MRGDQRHGDPRGTHSRDLELEITGGEGGDAGTDPVAVGQVGQEPAFLGDGDEWRQLIETLPQIVWITRPDGWHVHFNQQWMDFTGRTLEESLGHGWNPAFHPDDRARAAARWEEATRTGEPYEIEYRLRRADGTYRWMLGRAMPLRDPTGEIVRWFGTCTDIEDLKHAQAHIDEQAERLTTTLESITDAFWTVDRAWRITYVNRRAEEILRRSRDELLGQDLWEAFPQTVGSKLDEVYHRAMRTGTSEVIDEFPWKPLGIWLTIHVYPSEQGLAVYFQDVTEKHRARESLQEREAQLAQQGELLDKSRDAIIVRDLDHRITYWNKSAERLYGFAAEDVVGRSLRELLYDGSETFDQATAAVLEHGEWGGEFTHVTEEGDGLVVEARWSLVCDDDGQPTSVLAINSDVTERKRVEQQLLRTQRLESLGTLAGGIAHDLNNVLTPILLTVQTIQLAPDDPRSTEMLALIEQSAVRGAEMVRRVLSFARGVEGQRVELDVREVLGDVVRIARETFPKNIEVRSETPTTVWPVLGDATQLHQVLMNLCINARDAMPEGGTLHLRVDNVVVDENDPACALEMTPGNHVTVRIADDGVGMDSSTMDRIFEPFFTTKSQGDGTGLGLSTSHGIVKSHGGLIQVESEPGSGSTFMVLLPAATSSAAPASASAVPALPRGRGELVLVVDDEAPTRRATRQILERFGYRVLDASDGARAVRLFDQHADEVALLLTDMMMPNMDGPATIEAIRERDPDLPVIAISGLVASREVARATELGVDDLLPKPFSAAALLSTLDGLLSR